MKSHPLWHYILVIIVTIIKNIISEILWFFLGLGGYYILISKKTPYDVTIGLPLLLIGWGFVINGLLSELLSVFSPSYNRGVCFICKK